MIIETKFDINQTVCVKAIGAIGVITQIDLAGKNLTYKIEAWINSELRVFDQDEWQLEEVKTKGTSL